MRFTITDLPLSGLKRMDRHVIGDNRGFFSRLYCAETLKTAGWNSPIAQINHTYTAEIGTVRGLHFQYPPHAEKKMVFCLSGKIWDVVVDVRPNSSTFLCHHAEVLSSDAYSAIIIPEGFAHGFQCLSNDVKLIYLHSVAYDPSSEGGLNPFDNVLQIAWPETVTEISSRDAHHPLIDNTFKGVIL